MTYFRNLYARNLTPSQGIATKSYQPARKKTSENAFLLFFSVADHRQSFGKLQFGVRAHPHNQNARREQIEPI
ncbi:hypothetical protein [Rhizobium oryziradicis]|uniref:hypothetical protein n=1 Tax=Rhizobium oryziradicis TaxID=1867956 RepID=UPI000A4521B4|nr:hypothetical protein [Rhizobium oryziradicis]